MDLGLSGKTALVTAATAETGLAIAEALAREGVEPVVTGRERGLLDDLVGKLGAVRGVAARGLLLDASTGDGAGAIARELPGTDIPVNNLGTYESKSFGEIADADWLRIFEVDLMSGVRLSRSTVPGVLERG